LASFSAKSKVKSPPFQLLLLKGKLKVGLYCGNYRFKLVHFDAQNNIFYEKARWGQKNSLAYQQ
jgi:hypothetical protein